MKTIIVGVDRSASARSALRAAAELARSLGVRLVAAHVRDRSSAGADAPERGAADIVAEEVPDFCTETRSATGDVAECLAAIARSEDALMIVVGARRRGRSRAFLRARSAVGLVGLTDIPVLVAPLSTGSADAGRAGHRSPAPPEVAPDGGSGGTSTDPVRPARTTVEEQRRTRRTQLRPAWSRGPFQQSRPPHS